jgi:ribonuclease H / adenosylcobalamin/alpha-ribazole phosphatase
MPKLYLVRHAEHSDFGHRLTGRRRDVALTWRGRCQAAALGDRLRREAIRAIHASPCIRATETADAISHRVHVPVQLAEELDEIDFGDWTGSSFDELAGHPQWHCWNASRGSTCPPGGETMAAATARIRSFSEAALTGGETSAVVFVTHADMIRGYVCCLLGMPVDNLLRFEIDPASVTTIGFHAGVARLLGLNERIFA